MSSPSPVVNWGDCRLPETFWEHVQPCPMSGCWFWTGQQNRNGRAMCFAAQGRRHNVRRLVWAALVSPLPDTTRLLSRCDAECCNPQHLAPSTMLVDGELFRSCKSCRSLRPHQDFIGPSGHQRGACKSCLSRLGTIQAAEWRARNPGRYSEGKRRSVAQRRARKEAELGPAVRCEICGKGFTVSHLNNSNGCYDHNHLTGNGRGWLCPDCNSGIGLLGDNPRLLEAAAQYLRSRGHAATRPVIK